MATPNFSFRQGAVAGLLDFSCKERVLIMYYSYGYFSLLHIILIRPCV